ncbi:hypothetical protein, partial [Herbaspirillum huttiense]|uniref:hypothetical protein n=1 Tax=Herbaspirillum huttiense TaxID=863372 RepID=UPI002E780338
FHTGFGFLEYANNLLFGKSFLHAASVWGRLYIITVLILGSRSPSFANQGDKLEMESSTTTE